VQGREDDLIGIADPGTQGTWAQGKSRIVRFFVRGNFGDGFPVSHHSTRRGGKANQYYLRGFNLDHGTDIAIFLDDMRLTAVARRTARATRT